MRNTPLTLRFALDSMLGRLARYLLHAGYDTFYREEISDDELAREAIASSRILLTRDRDFIRRLNPGPETVIIQAQTLRESLEALQEGFNLRFHPEFFFTRCSECNQPLESVNRESVRDRIPEETAGWIDTYYRCGVCKKIYWKGSHHEDLVRTLREWNLLDEDPD